MDTGMQGGGTMTARSSLAQSHSYATLVVKDYDRAKRFYTDKLGLRVDDAPGMPGNGMAMTADGTGFQLYQNDKLPTPQNTVLTFLVKDFDATFQELKGKGVTFEDYDIPEFGIKTVDGVAEMQGSKSAWFKDSEGNICDIMTDWTQQ